MGAATEQQHATLEAQLGALRSQHARELAFRDEEHAKALQRLSAELTGSAEEAQAALLAQEKQARVDLVCRRAA
eukprot:6660336-Prymnesium_polylepis.1